MTGDIIARILGAGGHARDADCVSWSGEFIKVSSLIVNYLILINLLRW